MPEKSLNRTDKAFDDDLIVVKYVYRPLSCRVARGLNISPNLITLISALCVTIGCFSIYIEQFFVGTLFIFLWQLLDHIDGDVAHQWNRKSNAGDFFDTITCYYAVSLMFIIASVITGSVIGYFVTITYIYSRLIYQKYKNYKQSISTSVQTNFRFPALKLISQVRRELISPSGFMPFLLIFDLIFNNNIMLVGTIMIIDHILSVAYLVFSAKKLDE